ncbi:MAG TPA: DUF1820 family protein [Gammaproteobacteria bacterium]|nr:DUF1820 family protein [Gammaproteobacteria bacterium]
MPEKNQIFKVIFYNQDKLYEVHARQVHQAPILGFVELEDLIFGEKSGVLVDPSEERLKAEFAGVKRTCIPLGAIVRIDEVAREGANKIHPAGGRSSNVTPFPSPFFTPPSGDNK